MWNLNTEYTSWDLLESEQVLRSKQKNIEGIGMETLKLKKSKRIAQFLQIRNPTSGI